MTTQQAVTTYRKRRSRAGCAVALLPIGVIIAVLLFAVPRMSAEKESAHAVVNVSPRPTRTQEPTTTPTASLTPNYARQTVDSADAMASMMRLTVIAGDATRQADIDYAVLADRRTATERAHMTEVPATQTAVVASQILIAKQLANEDELSRVNRNVDATKRVIFEIIVPLAVIATIAGIVLAFVVKFGRIVLDFVEADTINGLDEDEDVDHNALAPVIEVISDDRKKIVRSHVSNTVLDVLPKFADYALSVGSDESVNPLTDTIWAGEQKRGVTKGDWYTFRTWLIDNGFGRWKNDLAHAQGAELTDSGWLLMKGIVENGIPSPTELGLAKV